jgi:hypothetical protein
MVRKKLITLACAAGIVACGACFLPPPHEPPPPPPRIDLSGSRAIRVEVTNASAAQHIDPADLSRWIAVSINAQRRAGIPPARADGKAGEGDAVLRVSIVDESLVNAPTTQGSSNAVQIQLTLDATLTRPGGAIVWQETKHPYRSNGDYILSASGDSWIWKSEKAWVQHPFCTLLVARMFAGEP